MKPEIEVSPIQTKWKWNKSAQITREIEFQPLAAEVIVRLRSGCHSVAAVKDFNV